MRATVDKVLTQIKEFFSGLSKKERTRFIVLGVLILGLSVLAAWLLGRTVWVPLEAGLTPAEAGQYKAALEEQGYRVKLADGGGTVLVPEENRVDAVVFLGMQGFGASGGDQSLDVYDLFYGSLGATDQDKRAGIQWQYQSWLQNDLTRTYDFVDSAVVRLSIGEKATGLLSPQNPTTAAIIVTVPGGGQLGQNQVTAIINHMAGSVDGLTAENISLSDSLGTVYDAASGTVAGGDTSTRMSLERQTREVIERQLNNLFVPVTGAGNLRVMVTLELDMDETTIDSVEFAPPVEGQLDGMKVSTYNLWESSRAGQAAEGVVGTDVNGMGTVEYPYDDLDEDEYYSKRVEEVNYELNEVRQHIIKEKGAIKRLSVGISVNSETVSEDYLADMQSLAATALGVNAQAVQISRFPFSATPETADPGTTRDFYDILSLIIKPLVVLLLGLVIIFFLWNIFRPARKEQLVLADGTGMGIDYMADGDMGELGDGLFESGIDGEALPSLDEIDLKTKDGTVIQLENFIDKDPAAVVQLLRNWISDDV